jgi:hypothetical protein
MLSISPPWQEDSMTALITTTPQMELAIEDIKHLVEELHAYHASYEPLVQRREQPEAVHTYLQGLLAPFPRRPIALMVLTVEGVARKVVRAMPSCTSTSRFWRRTWGR